MRDSAQDQIRMLTSPGDSKTDLSRYWVPGHHPKKPQAPNRRQALSPGSTGSPPHSSRHPPGKAQAPSCHSAQARSLQGTQALSGRRQGTIRDSIQRKPFPRHSPRPSPPQGGTSRQGTGLSPFMVPGPLPLEDSRPFPSRARGPHPSKQPAAAQPHRPGRAPAAAAGGRAPLPADA
jgi:hypothetical protein